MEPPKRVRSGSEKRRRQHAVRIRLDDAERSKLETLAGDHELSLAAYLRLSALGDKGPRARRRAPVDGELLARANAELNRVGSNLNQIARALNIQESVALASIEEVRAELMQTLVGIRRAVGGYDVKN